jgi:hypothetical protein
MNFNSTTLRAGLKRLDHPDRYVKKTSSSPALLFHFLLTSCTNSPGSGHEHDAGVRA